MFKMWGQRQGCAQWLMQKMYQRDFSVVGGNNLMHETTIASRNMNAECRRCAQNGKTRTFKRGEKVFVAGKNSAHKYYCSECASEIEV